MKQLILLITCAIFFEKPVICKEYIKVDYIKKNYRIFSTAYNITCKYLCENEKNTKCDQGANRTGEILQSTCDENGRNCTNDFNKNIALPGWMKLKNSFKLYARNCTVERGKNIIILPGNEECLFSPQICWDKQYEAWVLWNNENLTGPVLFAGLIEEWTLLNDPIKKYVSFKYKNNDYFLQLLKKDDYSKRWFTDNEEFEIEDISKENSSDHHESFLTSKHFVNTFDLKEKKCIVRSSPLHNNAIFSSNRVYVLKVTVIVISTVSLVLVIFIIVLQLKYFKKTKQLVNYEHIYTKEERKEKSVRKLNTTKELVYDYIDKDHELLKRKM